MKLFTVVQPGEKIQLADLSTRAPKDADREQARAETATLQEELATLQELLWGASTHGLLVALQGMDASGKDGAIRKAMGAFNPQGTRVHAFKVPTARELAQDYLWRIHQRTPPHGSVVIFNRSHYEDVTVVKVKGLRPKAEVRARYDDINAFEGLLCRTGTIVVKFYLHISRDEQKGRLLEREQDPSKYWKLTPSDWVERQRWDDYMEAYGEVFRRCSPEHAPWTIVPADQKWFRDLAISTRLVEVLRAYKDGWLAALEEKGRRAKAELDALPSRS